LRILLIGSGLLFVWRFLPIRFPLSKEKELNFGGNFRVIEDGEKLIFFNQKEEKIFALNKEGEIEVGD